MASPRVILAPEIEECEELLREISGRKYAFLVSSGTAALEIALEAVGVEPGSEVILPSLTWQADLTAVQSLAAQPVLCDVNRETLTLSVEAAQDAVSARTRAIIFVHLYSSFSDIRYMKKLSQSVPLIEDACHLFGTNTKFGPVGSFGDVSIVSFQAMKVFECGEGGCVLTDDPSLAAHMASLRNVGWVPDDLPVEGRWQGTNRRMGIYQARVLLEQLKNWKATRDEAHQTLREVLAVLKDARNEFQPLVSDFDLFNGPDLGLLPYYLAIKVPQHWSDRQLQEAQTFLNRSVKRGNLPPYPVLPDDPNLNPNSRPFFNGLKKFGLDVSPVTHSRKTADEHGRRLLMIHGSRLRGSHKDMLLEALEGLLTQI